MWEGYQSFAFVVGDFDTLSAVTVTMCPIMAGKHSLFNQNVSLVVWDDDFGSA